MKYWWLILKIASYDEEGNIRKVPKCSCAVIVDYGVRMWTDRW